MDYEKFIKETEELSKQPSTEEDQLFPLLCKFIDGWDDPEEFLKQFTLTDLLGIGNHFSELMRMHEKTRDMNNQLLKAIESCTPISQRRLL